MEDIPGRENPCAKALGQEGTRENGEKKEERLGGENEMGGGVIIGFKHKMT